MHTTAKQVSNSSSGSFKGRLRHSNCTVLPVRAALAAAAIRAAAAGAAEQQVAKQQQQQKPQYSTDAVTAAEFEEEQYEHTQQAKSRHNWAASVRWALLLLP
jgi:hypothetical protein